MNYPAWLVVCASVRACVHGPGRVCLYVTWSRFELCQLHAHPDSELQGNVGVMSARPLTLGLSTCITHTHRHIRKHIHVYTARNMHTDTLTKITAVTETHTGGLGVGGGIEDFILLNS